VFRVQGSGFRVLKYTEIRIPIHLNPGK